MRVERLPFTVYDIVGYLFPGLILIIGLMFFFEYTGIANVSDGIETLRVRSAIVAGVFLLVIAYAIGHAISLAASLSIEKLVVTFVGYPSQYLLPITGKEYDFKTGGDARDQTRQAIESIQESQNSSNSVFWMRWMLRPLYISLLIANKFGVMLHFVKRIGNETQVIFNKRFFKAFEVERFNLDGKQWFSLVENTIWCHSPGGAARLYNYLTIYGFCRNLSLVTYILFLTFFAAGFVLALCSVTAPVWQLAWILSALREFLTFLVSSQFWWLQVFAFLSFAMSLILMFGFLKFYRRYSYEAIYNFVLIDRSILDEIGSLPSEVKPTIQELYNLLKKDIQAA